MALFVDLVVLSNGLHGSVQMDSVALFSWIGWLRHHGILSYDTLLQEGDFTKKEKLAKKKTETFTVVYWCLVTAVYLGWSLWTKQWDTTYMIWPVAAVLYAAMYGIVRMVMKLDK